MEKEKSNSYVKIIFAIGIATSFVINTVMFTQEATRRSADDVAKIQQSAVNNSDFDEQKECLEYGGVPQFGYQDKYVGCGGEDN